MRDWWKLHKDRAWDIGILVAISSFTIWVIGWQSAHLAAPTAAIATTAIATYERHTTVRKAYSLVFVMGMIATGFMWLLSTTKERLHLAPASAAEGWIIMIGWGITVSTIITATLLTIVPVNYFTRIPRHPKGKLLFDYTVGVGISIVVMIPTIAIMRIVENSVGQPGDVQEATSALFLLAPMYGWFFTYALRNKPSSVWRPPTDTIEQKE